MRHGFESRHFYPPVDVLAQANRQLGGRIVELIRFQNLAEADQLTPRIRHFNADRIFPRQPFDKDRLSLQAQTEILIEGDNLAVLDPRFGLEFESRYYRARVDLSHRAEHIELLQLTL